jgi:hypothetical protein
MFGKWYQLYVKAPKGNGYTTPQAMKRIDDHLVQITTASFATPVDLPVQEADGSWEVRVLVESDLNIVKGILTRHYGLEIVREVPHDQ